MKFFLKALLSLIAAIVAFQVWMHWPVKLAIPSEQANYKLPVVAPVDIKLSLLETGYIESQHAMNVRGGDWSSYRSGVMAVLIEHPQGRFLIDAGFGRNAEQHFLTTPALMQAVAKLSHSGGTIDALAAMRLSPSDLDGILLTHAHWDHTSGLEDLSQVPVITTVEEVEFMRSGEEHVVLVAKWLDQLTLKAVPFDSGAMAGFERSQDLFGDGSVILLPMPGHTPGSMAVLVNQANGESLLFVGDTAWAHEGVDWPAEKPYISKVLVDSEPDAVADWLIQLHQMQAQNPKLSIIPAHDRRRYSAIK